MTPIYLIYMYKRRIKVRKGSFDDNGNFRPDDNPKTWQSWGGRRPPKYLEFCYGKTWCFREDVGKAVGLLVERQLNYRKEVINRAEIFKATGNPTGGNP